ncbi:creatininase family protein [Algoriphagus halophytocola]|uniref:creatininase family protein n=1 Tax=Algoriphagus halophytocola TaxID=2991499 RepID=UPI0022DD0663|nr:creatininase family protein [Algoriphagus sp. TR-M9]WBL43672.1 creatininase family protein [Algoriphagus sp. TR-M9]
MKPYLLKESNWKNLETHRFDLAVLPWGATEAHNYHLPYGTDVYEADAVAEQAGKKAWAKGANVTILPSIPFGVNTGQSDIYLDINLNPSTQMLILKDIITVLDRQGTKKLLIVNSHGGNDFKTMLRELGLQFPEMMLFTCNWFQSLDKTKYFEEEGDHADEMETSIIMHLHPELVLPLEQAGDGAEKKSIIQGVREKWAWAERKWSDVTDDTGIGNPKKSSPEKGRKYLEDVTDKVAQLMLDICEAKPGEIYR